MSIRLATFTALSLVMAMPAFADCREELTKLEQPAVTAETGAATNQSGMPVTKHQEEVMPGKQGTSEETGSTGGTTSGQVEGVSPHQKQVTGQPTDQPSDQVPKLMTEARQMAEAGDETGCMEKVTQLKELMGAK
jgi:hypothetical protein